MEADDTSLVALTAQSATPYGQGQQLPPRIEKWRGKQ